MKTAEEILKKHYDILTGGDTEEWEDFDEDTKSKECMLNAMKEYAQSVAQQAIENASENVKLVISNYKANNKGICGWVETELKDNLFIINDGANIVASKSSITNPDNIPITI